MLQWLCIYYGALDVYGADHYSGVYYWVCMERTIIQVFNIFLHTSTHAQQEFQGFDTLLTRWYILTDLGVSFALKPAVFEIRMLKIKIHRMTPELLENI